MAKPQVPKTEVDIDNNSWVRWFTAISDRSSNILTLVASLAPASIPANITAEQTFTVAGIQKDDVILNSITASNTAGIVIYNAKVTALNTVKIIYGNLTGGAVVPASQNYTFYIIRI